MKRLTLLVVAVLFFAFVRIANAVPPQIPVNASPNSSNMQSDTGHFSAGGMTINGSISVNALGTPAAPTVAATCDGTCATTYTYFCVAEDINAVSSTGVGESVPSASAITTVQAATLTATRFNTITCAGDKSVVSFLILKADSAHSLARCYTASGQCSVIDNSTTVGTAYTANSVDQTANITGLVGSGAMPTGVAIGSVFVSNGVGAAPVYSTTPVLGIAGTSSGTLTLANATGTGTYKLASAATTTTYTETTKAVVPAQGDILDYSNGTGQRSSLVDVATGSVVVSGGVGSVPTYSTTPTLGLGGTTSGTLTLSNATGAGTFTLASAANTTTYTLTAPTTAPAFAGQMLVSTTGGVSSWVYPEGSILSVSGLLGAQASTAGATLLQTTTTATRAGHFVDLQCTDDFLTACTTAPSFNVRDVTSSTSGTAVACSNTAGSVTQAETLVFAAGDQIAITRTINGGTCTVPFFGVQAHAAYGS